MLSDSDRLLATVEQVLKAGELGQRQRQHNRTVIDLGALVADCIAITLQRHHLPPEAIVLDPIPGAVRLHTTGIPEDLRTAVLNLLDNAVKYSPNGVHIRCSLAITRYTWVTLRITDNGLGLPANQLKRIFKRFYRVPGRDMVKIKGTGLGLFLVRNIARQHGGRRHRLQPRHQPGLHHHPHPTPHHPPHRLPRNPIATESIYNVQSPWNLSIPPWRAMLLLWKSFVLAFSALLPLVNPLGSALIFLGLVGSQPISVYRSLSRKIAINSVLFFAVIQLLGSGLLAFFGISLPIVQLAGGLVIASIGWTCSTSPTAAPTVDKNASRRRDGRLIDQQHASKKKPSTPSPFPSPRALAASSSC